MEKVYVEEKKHARMKDSIDRLLSMPPAPAPEDYQQWERNIPNANQAADETGGIP